MTESGRHLLNSHVTALNVGRIASICSNFGQTRPNFAEICSSWLDPTVHHTDQIRSASPECDRTRTKSPELTDFRQDLVEVAPKSAERKPPSRTTPQLASVALVELARPRTGRGAESGVPRRHEASPSSLHAWKRPCGPSLLRPGVSLSWELPGVSFEFCARASDLEERACHRPAPDPEHVLPRESRRRWQQKSSKSEPRAPGRPSPLRAAPGAPPPRSTCACGGCLVSLDGGSGVDFLHEAQHRGPDGLGSEREEEYTSFLSSCSAFSGGAHVPLTCRSRMPVTCCSRDLGRLVQASWNLLGFGRGLILATLLTILTDVGQIRPALDQSSNEHGQIWVKLWPTSGPIWPDAHQIRPDFDQTLLPNSG